eukprot:scaffold179657_cov31-Prasinocladus_malaysianus.AAC.1
MAWAGPLFTFFASAGYTFLYASYGKQDDGYMGVAVAVPLRLYEVVDARLGRLSETVQWPKARRKRGPASPSDVIASSDEGDDDDDEGNDDGDNGDNDDDDDEDSLDDDYEGLSYPVRANESTTQPSNTTTLATRKT